MKMLMNQILFNQMKILMKQKEVQFFQLNLKISQNFRKNQKKKLFKIFFSKFLENGLKYNFLIKNFS